VKALWVLLLICATAQAHESDVAFEARPGAAVPAALSFRESPLVRYLGAAPVVLVLGYESCVNLCGMTLEGASEALRRTGLAPERDYTALFVSIDPRDEKAAPRRRPGWHFLTGAAAAARVAQAVGFRYRFDQASGEFAHPAGFVVLTPQGRVSRYFEGVRFDPAELKRSLLDASRGEARGGFEGFLLRCFRDPDNGRNTATVLAAVRIALIAFLLGFGWVAWRRLR
jgi:protein SCO1/2